jgi:hypothetical protein
MGGGLGHSSSVDRLSGVGGRGREELSDFANVSEIASIRDCFNSLRVNVFEKPVVNIFDVKSNRKLDYILRHGYSFKHHEKKHYRSQKSLAAYKRANQDFLNVTLHNKSVMDCLHPKPAAKDESLSLSLSTQNAYAELFNDRYRKLAQNIMESAQDEEKAAGEQKPGDPRMPMAEGRVADELSNAKKNRIYKDLGMNLNLKEMFHDLNYDELMKLRKLHVLYATQKAKPKDPSQPSIPPLTLAQVQAQPQAQVPPQLPIPVQTESQSQVLVGEKLQPDAK